MRNNNKNKTCIVHTEFELPLMTNKAYLIK